MAAKSGRKNRPGGRIMGNGLAAAFTGGWPRIGREDVRTRHRPAFERSKPMSKKNLYIIGSLSKLSDHLTYRLITQLPIDAESIPLI